MRALVVTNMYPTPERPAFGRFVQDQVEALRRLPDMDVEVSAFAGGTPAAYLAAARRLRRRYAPGTLEVVHAHFGLSAWPALAAPARIRGVTLHGTDISHPRSRAITLPALRRMDLVAAVSSELAAQVPGWASRTPVRVLPCGVDLYRFRRVDRGQARAAIGVDPARPCLLFPADPTRPEKRHELAAALAARLQVPLLTLGSVAPERVVLYVNAASAVLVTSSREGFGLSVLEALACDVPVLATPHGVAPEALAGVSGTLCAEFDERVWAAALAPHLARADPRVRGRTVAELYSVTVTARTLASTWEELLAGS